MKLTSSSLHLARKRARKIVIRKCVTTSVCKASGKSWASWKRTKDISLLWKCFCTTYSFHRTRFRTRYSAAFKYFTKIRNLESNHKEFVLLEFYHKSKILFIPTKMLDEVCKSSSVSFYSKVLNEECLSNVWKLLTTSSLRYLSVVIEDIPIVSACNWPIAWSRAVSWHLRMSSESQGSWLDSCECTTAL